jgi:hypothetical protein
LFKEPPKHKWEDSVGQLTEEEQKNKILNLLQEQRSQEIQRKELENISLMEQKEQVVERNVDRIDTLDFVDVNSEKDKVVGCDIMRIFVNIGKIIRLT